MGYRPGNRTKEWFRITKYPFIDTGVDFTVIGWTEISRFGTAYLSNGTEWIRIDKEGNLLDNVLGYSGWYSNPLIYIRSFSDGI